ncbi:MAG: N-acetylmuramoyl-L-alanine amidase [Candidatus Magasanikbacteria bacterium]|nr:N-acetylmuramoyl-L-alanine amidase [Candidatus Magasanikbacteria bacterium]
MTFRKLISSFLILNAAIILLPHLVLAEKAESPFEPTKPEGKCNQDTDCPTNKFCEGGLDKDSTIVANYSYDCVPQLENNKICNRPRQCKTNFCGSAQGGEKQCMEPETNAGYLKFAPIAPKLEIKIPTLLPFTTKGLEKPDDQGNIYFPFIGQYIVGIYKWMLLVAGIIATIMIILGGFTYLTSGGNATQAGAGKERIGSAIFGLILLLGSYMLLYLINPGLVEFRSLKIKIMETADLADDPKVMKDPIDSPSCTGPNSPSKSSGIGDITYLGQLDNLACGTRDLSKIKYIVIHEGGKTTASTVNIFKQRGVSSHYSIDQDGKIYQLVGEEKRAWHAGPINAYSIGIDLSHTKNCPGSGPSPNCTYTDEMIASLNKLINSIINRTGIGVVKSDQSIIGHCQVEGTTHTDPRNLDWSKLGLNNAAHYKNGNDLASKCKIVFNAAAAKQTKQTKESSEGCCTLSDNATLPNTFEPDCSTLFNGINWSKGDCPNP